MISAISTSLLLSALLLAAASDLRSRRIPNALTVTALLCALLLRGLMGGGALVDGLLGMGLALLILLPLFAMGGVGGGDAKLLIMVGAFLGTKDFGIALLVTALIGGAMSLVAAARRGVILPVLFSTRDLAKNVFTFGRGGERTTLASPGVVSVPYGVAIAIGSAAALYIGGGL